MSKAGSAAKVKLNSFDDLFDDKIESNASSAKEIELDKLIDFENHPYHVNDDEEMKLLVLSVIDNGILNPIIVREKKGFYEILSGHRRKRAAEIAGLKSVPCIVKCLSDDEATVLMVDSNMYRSNILPSEKAWAYRMKNESLKNQGKRNDLNGSEDNKNTENTADSIGKEFSDSSRTVHRFIRLTYLKSQLLDLVDENKLTFLAAVNISYMNIESQQNIYAYYEETGVLPDKNDSEALKKLAKEKGTVTFDDIFSFYVTDEAKPKTKSSQKLKVTLKNDVLKKYFTDDTSEDEISKLIVALLENYFMN